MSHLTWRIVVEGESLRERFFRLRKETMVSIVSGAGKTDLWA